MRHSPALPSYRAHPLGFRWNRPPPVPSVSLAPLLPPSLGMPRAAPHALSAGEPRCPSPASLRRRVALPLPRPLPCSISRRAAGPLPCSISRRAVGPLPCSLRRRAARPRRPTPAPSAGEPWGHAAPPLLPPPARTTRAAASPSPSVRSTDVQTPFRGTPAIQSSIQKAQVQVGDRLNDSATSKEPSILHPAAEIASLSRCSVSPVFQTVNSNLVRAVTAPLIFTV
uniref:Uncharacterized protein n=1 Tax=Setaria viridis TaxID=4556 RepID=A0A4U6VC02_SETVI|nr:hypothetical protein SEVIR_3G142150v2 [Setaria viridis]